MIGSTTDASVQESLALMKDLNRIAKRLRALSPHLRSTAREISECADSIPSCIVDALAPTTVDEVRAMPRILQKDGLSAVIDPLDTSLELEDDDPDFICMDWWWDQLSNNPKYTNEMLNDASVVSARDVIAWINRRAETGQIG